MNPLPLTILSQNSLKVTVGWTKPADAVGYRFFRDSQPVSSSWDPLKTQVTFGLPDGKPHTFTVLAVTGEAQGTVTVNGAAPPPPPPPSGKLWGISPSTTYSPSIDTQMVEFVKLGATCPRIYGDDASANAARAHGIKHWFAWGGNTGYMWTPSQAVAYCQKYPECVGLELGNELNLNGAWTAQKVSDMQQQFWTAMTAAGLQGKVMLPSVGNNLSTTEKLSMLDWCKKLVSLGCKPGAGFAIANYHNYGGDPVAADRWQECWTAGRHGTSCQQVFGKPPFVVTEFGAKVGKDVNTEADQAASATAWVKTLGAIPECMGGHWFQAFDGNAWAGYGLIDSAGNRRPSWQAFHDAIN